MASMLSHAESRFAACGCGGGSSPSWSCWWWWEARWRSSLPSRHTTSPIRTSSSRSRRRRPPRPPRRRPRSTTSPGRGTATTPGAPERSPPATRPTPPLHVGWRFQDYALLEFPPVIYREQPVRDGRRRLGQGARLEDRPQGVGDQGGNARGRLAGAGGQAGPAVTSRCCRRTATSPGNGRFVALSMKTGRIVWSKVIPAGTESSPIAVGNSVYFGDQGGNVYSLNATTGHINWTYHASARGQGRPGDLQRDRVLRRLLRARLRAQRDHRPPGLGGEHERRRLRVRLGQLLLDAGGGVRPRLHGQHRRPRVLVRGQTAASSRGPPGPAPTCTRRRRSKTRPGSARPSTSGPTTATSTRSTPSPGAISWRHPAGGKISGSATIVGNVVYYSDLGIEDHRRARRSHRPAGVLVPRRGVQSGVADNGAIYLSGYTMLYQMLPDHHRHAGARRR